MQLAVACLLPQLCLIKDLRRLDFSADSTKIVTASMDRTWRMYDVRQGVGLGKCIAEGSSPLGEIARVALSHDGSVVAAVVDSAIQVRGSSSASAQLTGRMATCLPLCEISGACAVYKNGGQRSVGHHSRRAWAPYHWSYFLFRRQHAGLCLCRWVPALVEESNSGVIKNTWVRDQNDITSVQLYM